VKLYNGIHKIQRSMLFDISVQAGRTDPGDSKQIEALANNVKMMKDELVQHARYEEEYVHPIIAERVPGCVRGIEADHKKMHEDLEDLSRSIDLAKAKIAGFETMPQIGHEFYLAWNRFVAFYLTHIDFEEGHVQPLLWGACTDAELAGIFQAIFKAQTPEEMSFHGRSLVPVVTPEELAEMLNKARPTMSAAEFVGFLAYVSKTLRPEEWKVLQSRLGWIPAYLSKTPAEHMPIITRHRAERSRICYCCRQTPLDVDSVPAGRSDGAVWRPSLRCFASPDVLRIFFYDVACVSLVDDAQARDAFRLGKGRLVP
jgi:hypothetical protein